MSDMSVEKIVLDRKEARELYQQYKAHQHYSQPIDHEIQRAYQLIAQGRMVIRALDSIKTAGVYEDGENKGLPKLAIVRATADRCYLRIRQDGGATMTQTASAWSSRRERAGTSFIFPAGTFKENRSRWDAFESATPIVPIHLRPKRGLQNYHVLWEAEWTKRVPVDPMLLRRIGDGDMWLVVAAWDLTEVERAALSTRLSA